MNLLHHQVLRPPIESAQYLSIRYSSRLTEAGISPSVGSVGDSYDNALAESVIGLYKTKITRKNGRRRNPNHLEDATFIHRLVQQPTTHRTNRGHPTRRREANCYSRKNPPRWLDPSKPASVTPGRFRKDI